MRKLRDGNITCVPVKNATLEKMKKVMKNVKTIDWRYYMMKKIRKILWYIGITESCPLCGKDVEKIGYPEDDIWQKYKCSSSECNFGKAEKFKPT